MIQYTFPVRLGMKTSWVYMAKKLTQGKGLQEMVALFWALEGEEWRTRMYALKRTRDLIPSVIPQESKLGQPSPVPD